MFRSVVRADANNKGEQDNENQKIYQRLSSEDLERSGGDNFKTAEDVASRSISGIPQSSGDTKSTFAKIKNSGEEANHILEALLWELTKRRRVMMDNDGIDWKAEAKAKQISHVKAMRGYAQSINHLDPRYVEPYIGKKFSYHFEWNLEQIILFSKDEFLHYITHRFSTFILQGRHVWGELVVETTHPTEPCVLIAVNNINVVCGLVVGVLDDDFKLKSLTMVQIPLCEWHTNAHIGWTDRMTYPQRDYNVKRTGKYPK